MLPRSDLHLKYAVSVENFPFKMVRSSIRSARYLLASGCSVALNVALALSALIPHLSDNTSGVTLGCRSLDSNVLRVGISRDRGSYCCICWTCLHHAISNNGSKFLNSKSPDLGSSYVDNLLYSSTFVKVST